MKQLFFILLLWSHCALLAQQSDSVSVYYRNFNKERCDSAFAQERVVDQYTSTKGGIRSVYLIPSATLAFQENYADFQQGIKHGKCVRYYSSGAERVVRYYKNNKADSVLRTYTASGSLRREEWYRNDSLLSSKCYALNGSDTTYYPLYREAAFPGGLQRFAEFLKEHIKYPKKARRKGIEGAVWIRFVIGRNGELTRLQVDKSVDPLLDEAAMEVIRSMPRWIPAIYDGELEPMVFRQPIRYMLQ